MASPVRRGVLRSLTRAATALILLAGALTVAVEVVAILPAAAIGATTPWAQFDTSNLPCTSACASSPSPRYAAAMAYDPATSQLVLFGGFAPGFVNDTWVWSGKSWAQVDDASDPGCTNTCIASPAPRGYASMAYDPATSQLILFGGRGPEFGDTWAWNGSMWTQLTPVTSPAARDSAALAYDQTTRTLVLFGGDDGTLIRNDTWSWNGTTWTQVDDSPLGCTNNCAASPPARQIATMATDPAGGTVLFGGETGNNVSSNLNDTWVWSGAAWTQVDDNPASCTNNCTASPSARQGTAMVDDTAPGASQIVLFGGLDVSSSELGDTWIWSPVSFWSQASPATSPGPRDTAALAFDGTTLQPVLFGGENPSLNDTWTYGSAATTTSVTSSVNPSGVGQSVTLTATIAATTGTFDNGGTVQFTVDGSNFGQPKSITAGTAMITESALAAGDHVITATYSGDSSFYGSTGSLSGGQRGGNNDHFGDGLLARGNRRWDFHVRWCAILRINGLPATERTRRGDDGYPQPRGVLGVRGRRRDLLLR